MFLYYGHITVFVSHLWVKWFELNLTETSKIIIVIFIRGLNYIAHQNKEHQVFK